MLVNGKCAYFVMQMLYVCVCSSFLITVCMFIVLKALLVSNATVIVLVGGGGAFR